MSDAEEPSQIPLGPSIFGWNRELGLNFLKAHDREVIVEMTATEKHQQPMGIVHGGVYSALVETVCSVGAHLAAQKHNRLVVGLDNHTSFLKATREGRLCATARPLVTGRRTQLWQADVTNDAGDVVATGRVRLLCIDPGSSLGGEGAKVKARD
jgi:uncharacterized protein (TIGR00369 family)